MIFQEGRRAFPQPLDFVGAREQQLVAEHHVVQQSLVRFQAVHVERPLDVERQRRARDLQRRAGELHAHLDRYLGIVGELEDDFVGTLVLVRLVEETLLGLVQSDRDDAARRGHLLARSQQKRDSPPAVVLDLRAQRHERLGG